MTQANYDAARALVEKTHVALVRRILYHPDASAVVGLGQMVDDLAAALAHLSSLAHDLPRAVA